MGRDLKEESDITVRGIHLCFKVEGQARRAFSHEEIVRQNVHYVFVSALGALSTTPFAEKDQLAPPQAPPRPYLWPGIPQADNGVNAAGGQEAITGVRLEAVHNRLVSLQDAHQVSRFLLPDEEGAVVGAADDVLSVAGESESERNRDEALFFRKA